MTEQLIESVYRAAAELCEHEGEPLVLDRRQFAVTTTTLAVAQSAGCRPPEATRALARLRADGRICVEPVRGRGVRLVWRRPSCFRSRKAVRS